VQINLKSTNLLKNQEDKKMAKCVYCKNDIADGRAVDVCDRCGVGVWGEKMFKAIIQNMDTAKQKGDLMQGSINVDKVPKNLKG
jgi:hypothetical protein